MQHYNAPTAILAEIPGYVTETDSLVVDTIPGNTPLPDKSLLLNTYTASPTDAQKEAVAQLMLYCGTSVEMDYSSSSSGAVTRNVANSLVTYFGFDKTVQPLDRYNFTYAAWLWDQEMHDFVSVKGFDELFDPEFNKEAKTISSSFRMDDHEDDAVYKWNGQELEMVSSETIVYSELYDE